MAKFKTRGLLLIDDIELRWSVLHYGGASSAYENHRGLSVSVSVNPGKARELIIEFPLKDYFFNERPKNQSEFESRLGTCVKAALEAGWQPHSRGKAFVYKAGEN